MEGRSFHTKWLLDRRRSLAGDINGTAIIPSGAEGSAVLRTRPRMFSTDLRAICYLAGAGVEDLAGAGAEVVCPALMPDSTEREPLLRWIRTVSPMDVNMNTMAAYVVTLVSRLAAPRGPNAV